MSYYRIKIEESNNGDKRYAPQVGEERLRLGRFVHLFIEWKNIIEDTTSFWVTPLAQASHNTEQKALDVIEGYKQHLQNKKGKKTKTTTYKIIE